MATISERTAINTDYAESADYRELDWRDEDVLEATYGARIQVERNWRDTDNLDGVGVGVVRVPPGDFSDAVAGVRPIRYAKIELEPSANANTIGVEFRVVPITATALWLRAPSATQKGLWLFRNLFIVVPAIISINDPDGALYFRTTSTTRLTLKVTLLGDKPAGG